MKKSRQLRTIVRGEKQGKNKKKISKGKGKVLGGGKKN